MRLSRSRVVVVAVVVAALAGVAVAILVPLGEHGAKPPPGATAKPCAEATLGTDARPSCGTWWGAAMDTSKTTLPRAVSALEQQTGRRLDIVHTFHRWYDAFPTAAERSVADAGRMLFINWQPTDSEGRGVPWSAIAAGKSDGRIDAVARKLKDLGRPVFLSFSHEPEANVSSAPAPTVGKKVDNGTPEQFAEAFRHVHDRMRKAGADNVIFVWTVMGLDDPVWLDRYAAMLPRDAVDWIAWDPYNTSCRGDGWKDFAQTVRPFYDWLQQHGYGDKPFMLAEYGTDVDPHDPARQAQWFQDAAGQLAQFPNLKALVYFDLPAPPATCTWLPRGTGAAAAFSAFARSDPFRRTAGIPLR